ncbi:DUF4235 domain-containing protein [Kocuria sp. JC486]|uniref:DUF4235 domain-containing protein n=1 Tax=Kocuria soli TaxID=2485125 RepID=A0A3N4AFF7_9MICC|nr:MULTISPECIES: DUF4235 domain-containing protein [Kocuria]NHU85036.1 DUF4235 domain-containing protein [Kocuria sp. JC486]ROZ65629.1 DUF4235 domain-containing protein [Kocuria soli]
MNDKVVGLAGTAASLAGVTAANKGLGAVWAKLTGNPPPAKNPDPEERWADILLWAVITGVVTTVVRVAVTRQVTKMQSNQGES